MENIPFLVGFITAVIELLKTTLASFNLPLTEAQRESLIRWMAALLGIGVAFAFQFDYLHPDAPTTAGIIVSGATLAIASDLLHVGTSAAKAAVARIDPGNPTPDV